MVLVKRFIHSIFLGKIYARPQLHMMLNDDVTVDRWKENVSRKWPKLWYYGKHRCRECNSCLYRTQYEEGSNALCANGW